MLYSMKLHNSYSSPNTRIANGMKSMMMGREKLVVCMDKYEMYRYRPALRPTQPPVQ
jgi:hypothetical protein